MKCMKKVKGKRSSFSGWFLFLSSTHCGCVHIFIGDDLASLCGNLGAVTDGLGKLWIWEWFEHLSSGHWLSEHKVKFRDPKSTPQKKIQNETCLLCRRIKWLFGHLCYVVFTAVADGALLRPCHAVLWYSPSTWSWFVYYLFKEAKKQALHFQAVEKGTPFLFL